MQMVEMFQVKTPSLQRLVVNLSGGNQQKVVLGKWLLTHPKILLFDEPTRGIDVGAKREIYNFISDYANRGSTVIMSLLGTAGNYQNERSHSGV